MEEKFRSLKQQLDLEVARPQDTYPAGLLPDPDSENSDISDQEGLNAERVPGRDTVARLQAEIKEVEMDLKDI